MTLDEALALTKASLFMRPSREAEALVVRALADQETEEDALAQLILSLVVTEDEIEAIKRCVDDEASSALARELLGSPALIAVRIRGVVSSGMDAEIMARGLMTKQEAVAFRSGLSGLADEWASVTWASIGGAAS